jgi:hypothetical protein
MARTGHNSRIRITGSLLALKRRLSISTSTRPSFNTHQVLTHRDICADYAARFPTSNITIPSSHFRQIKRFALFNRVYQYYATLSFPLPSSIICRPAPLPCFGSVLPRIPGFLPNGATAWRGWQTRCLHRHQSKTARCSRRGAVKDRK